MFKINLSLIFLAVLNTFADSRKLEKMEVGKIILLVKKARKQAATGPPLNQESDFQPFRMIPLHAEKSICTSNFNSE